MSRSPHPFDRLFINGNVRGEDDLHETLVINAIPEGEAGLGPALNNKPLPGWMIRFQVRHGLGAMPAFSEKEISDRELDDLVIAYLKAFR
ncbi:MAG: cytochrome c [Candidatus Manganitrophus sp.]|nr:cytochrome c [Candidatus Manganitrophus sp.]